MAKKHDVSRQRSPLFFFLNQNAWSVQMVAAVLMLWPSTRFLGAMMIVLSFVFIATQIRLGLLCHMVMVSGVFAFNIARTGRIAGIPEPIGAVHERGVFRHTHQRRRTTGEHRRRRAYRLDELQRPGEPDLRAVHCRPEDGDNLLGHVAARQVADQHVLGRQRTYALAGPGREVEVLVTDQGLAR